MVGYRRSLMFINSVNRSYINCLLLILLQSIKLHLPSPLIRGFDHYFLLALTGKILISSGLIPRRSRRTIEK